MTCAAAMRCLGDRCQSLCIESAKVRRGKSAAAVDLSTPTTLPCRNCQLELPGKAWRLAVRYRSAVLLLRWGSTGKVTVGNAKTGLIFFRAHSTARITGLSSAGSL
jgi:hypothetical protein